VLSEILLGKQDVQDKWLLSILYSIFPAGGEVFGHGFWSWWISQQNKSSSRREWTRGEGAKACHN